MKKAVMIIPALNPDEKLIKYCDNLIAAGFTRIIVVDDGSDEEHRQVFEALSDRMQIVIFRHTINLGKGRALKNALNYFMNMEDRDQFCGVITADSDGQHLIADVVRVQEAMSLFGDSLILGARDFNSGNVPPKSKFGNKCSIFFLWILHGMKLQDTQTGLRGIPTCLIPKLLDLFGERYEYETSMLVAAARSGIKYHEVPIATIYEDNNKGSHFRPIIDSWRIYKILLGTFFKYMASSVLSFLIDIGLFKLVLFLAAESAFSDTRKIILATVVARVLSSLFNFMMNKNVVFDAKGSRVILLVKYYALCIIQMACSAGCVAGFFAITGLSETVIKIIVDGILFFISFRIQRRFIFGETK